MDKASETNHERLQEEDRWLVHRTKRELHHLELQEHRPRVRKAAGKGDDAVADTDLSELPDRSCDVP